MYSRFLSPEAPSSPQKSIDVTGRSGQLLVSLLDHALMSHVLYLKGYGLLLGGCSSKRRLSTMQNFVARVDQKGIASPSALLSFPKQDLRCMICACELFWLIPRVKSRGSKGNAGACFATQPSAELLQSIQLFLNHATAQLA